MPAPRPLILVADDDDFAREDIGDALALQSYRLAFAKTAQEALEKTRMESPDLVILDLVFPDCDDLALLRQVKALPNAPEVVMVSGNTDEYGLIVEAIKLGAFDYVRKPYSLQELLNRVEKALHLRSLKVSQSQLVRELRSHFGLDGLLGESPAMKQVRGTLQRLADFEGCVLIRGDSGTGKELAARTLHYASKRANKPFVVVNCAAIPETLTESILFGHRKGAFTGAVDSAQGKFELAADGTVFLDEIGDMPLRQQAALLRVLEYRHFTPVGDTRERECLARFVFATNRDLKQAVREGAFREDLYHRINVSNILLPSLSTRPEDIPELVEHYSARLCSEMGRSPVLVSKTVLKVFAHYDWPGNVRELRNVLEAAIMLMEKSDQELTPEHLPADILVVQSSDEPQYTQIERNEKELIVEVLCKHRGNQTKAAEALGFHRNTLGRKIRYYSISIGEKGGQG
ncbi:MAG: sigma-54 dependent transcriptional regulator [Planctomycetota bacterium]|nr:sigma-54 dependent transcriptional regulator [Planctomycetota bacterium]